MIIIDKLSYSSRLADVSPEELLEVHRRFYQSRFPAHIYERFVQLPLAPGEAPNPPGNWMEE